MTRRTLALLVLLLVCAPSAHAATSPRPIRLATGDKVRVGPVLAGDRVVWARSSAKKKIITATRRGKRVADLPRIRGFDFDLRVSDLAASASRMGYVIVEREPEIRDDYSDIAFHFGTFTRGGGKDSLGFCEWANGACWWRGVGATRPRTIEISGNVTAWGPFHDGSDDPSADLILIKDYATDDTYVVHARRAGEFRLAGEFLAYRPVTQPAEGAIVVVRWRTGEVVRTISEPHPVVFDIDDQGQVAAARRLPGAVTAFGVYDSGGRFKRFPPRSFRDETRTGQIWIERGRVAFARTDTRRRRLWDVVTTTGVPVARMRAPADGALTDFDGNCLAFRKARNAVYVARVGRAPKGSICR